MCPKVTKNVSNVTNFFQTNLLFGSALLNTCAKNVFTSTKVAKENVLVKQFCVTYGYLD